MLQLVPDRWSIECWHWIRDTQLHADAHRYRGNGAGEMATLRTEALNLLRLGGFQSIRAGIQAVKLAASGHFWRWRCVSQSPRRADTLNQPCLAASPGAQGLNPSQLFHQLLPRAAGRCVAAGVGASGAAETLAGSSGFDVNLMRWIRVAAADVVS